MGDKPERFLWNPTEFSSITKQRQTETFESIRSRFESAPSTRSLWLLIANSHVVVQEIAITAYLLARHRLLIAAPPLSNSLQSALHAWSTFFIMSALGVVLGVGSQLQSSQDRKAKFRQRSADGILMATLLRFMASLLRSLTASYASDSLYTLAVGFLVVHVLSCDYLYANGDTDSYPKHADVNASDRLLFQGGTVSFNSALFSTALLASRLAISDAYVFIYFSIVLFAYYPVTRNSIAAAYPAISSVVLWLITLLVCMATLALIEVWTEMLLFAVLIFSVGFILPLWSYIAQRHKGTLAGPWDIPTSSQILATSE